MGLIRLFLALAVALGHFKGQIMEPEDKAVAQAFDWES